jgi:hypothetical protein
MTEKEEIDWARESMRNWRSWGSWFSWGSPVGLGLFFISIGVVILLLHLAGLIGQ